MNAPPNSGELIALYPGTFDGPTYGHLDLIRQGARLFNRLHVAVAVNDSKQPIFTVEERVELLREVTREISNVTVDSFSGLTMDYAEQVGARYVIRGIRVVSDFEYELQLALMNRAINARVQTLFMVPAVEHLFVSSSFVKQLVKLGGDAAPFVPPATQRMLHAKLNVSTDPSI